MNTPTRFPKAARWTLLVLLCAISLGAAAQSKIIERSAKKVPAWLKGATEGSIVATVSAPTLGEAQDLALTDVTEQIIQSVALNITVTQTSEMSEVNTNGDIDSRDAFSRTSQIRAANLPFLSGITMAKAEEIYWVKLQDKNTKAEHYEYSVKYPFTAKEQRKLKEEFEALEAEKLAEYNDLESSIHDIESVDEIQARLIRLANLKAYYFDQNRINMVSGLEKRYKDLYNQLTVAGTFLTTGQYQCQMLLDGTPIRVSTAPKVKSNCATELTTRATGDGMFVIGYNAQDCVADDDNYLQITFTLEGKRIAHKAYLNAAQGVGGGTFSVVPEGKVILSADSVDVAHRKVYDLNIRITVNNRGGTAFGLKAIELNVPEFSAPIVFDDVNATYRTKGIIQVRALAEGELTVLESRKSDLDYVQGALTLVNPETGAIERVRLNLPYVTNWH